MITGDVMRGGMIALNEDIHARVCSTVHSDPVHALEALVEHVETLGPNGPATLNHGQNSALTRKLAQRRYSAVEAVEVLLDFRQQVLDLEGDGVLGSSESAALVDAGDTISAAPGSA